MNTHRNIKVSSRLGLGFGVVLVMLLVVIGIGIFRLSTVNGITEKIIKQDWAKSMLANDVIKLANDNAKATMELFLLKDKSQIAKTLDRIEQNKKAILEKLEMLEGMLYRAEGKAMLVKIKEARTPYVTSFTRASKLLLDEGKWEEASRILVNETIPALNAYLDAINDLVKFQGKLLDESGIEAKEIYVSGRNLMTITGILAVILGAVIAFFITRSITRPLGGEPDFVADIAQRVSNGDLTITIDTRNNDEISVLSAMKKMVDSLKNVVLQTRESSLQVSVASNQIAQANQNLSQSITEQGASVEETSSTMEEMHATIRQTADNVREANKLTQNTKAIAESGTSAMTDTIKAMDDINHSSNKIANISNVIEEIAFQTNLLALNAAVEAARAGEHGKGFAVVASEIRSLAHRASESAKEITGLIEDSVEKTARGVQLAQELSTKLKEIEGSVKKVADLMDEVAAASQEQASGTSQINTAMTQIDKSTQANASIVEETASASEELAAQAKELMNLIAFFNVNEESTTGTKYRNNTYVKEAPKKERAARIIPDARTKATAPAASVPGAASDVNTTFSMAPAGTHEGFDEF